MESPRKTSNVNLTKKRTYLEYEIFICYLVHPTLVDTFHPCRLLPSGSQNPIRVLGDDPIRIACKS